MARICEKYSLSPVAILDDFDFYDPQSAANIATVKNHAPFSDDLREMLRIFHAKNDAIVHWRRDCVRPSIAHPQFITTPMYRTCTC